MRKITAAGPGGRGGAQFVVARGYNIIVTRGYNIEEVTKRLFTAVGHCSSLSSMNTTLERLQDRDNLVTLRNDNKTKLTLNHSQLFENKHFMG